MPIIRYGLDRQSLYSYSISRECQDKIYRALFVHSVGFYQFLRDITQHVENGKERLISSIWKVFQIVLECACDTDYKMITKRMEESTMSAIQKLANLNKSIVERGIEREGELKKDITYLVEAQRQLSEAQAHYELNKAKMDKKIVSNQLKVEEETIMRMHFENKVNLLHNINTKLEQQNFRLTEHNRKLIHQLKEIEVKFNEAEKQSRTYKAANDGLETNEKKLDLEAQIARRMKKEMKDQWREMMRFAEYKKEEIVGVRQKLSKAEE